MRGKNSRLRKHHIEYGSLLGSSAAIEALALSSGASGVTFTLVTQAEAPSWAHCIASCGLKERLCASLGVDSDIKDGGRYVSLSSQSLDTVSALSSSCLTCSGRWMGTELIQKKDIVRDCIKTWGGTFTSSECPCCERWREKVEGIPVPPWTAFSRWL